MSYRPVPVKWRPGASQCTKCRAMCFYHELFRHPNADEHPRAALCYECWTIASGKKWADRLAAKKAEKGGQQIALF